MRDTAADYKRFGIATNSLGNLCAIFKVGKKPCQGLTIDLESSIEHLKHDVVVDAVERRIEVDKNK